MYRRTVRRPVSLAITLALAAPAAFAQEAELDEVVVTAAGFEQKITDAPASISIVSSEELRARPYITLVDAVRELEGVDVGETSDKTGQRTVSIRGMGADYTLVMIDGKRQNNHGDIYPNSFGGNQFGHVPPLDAIERIEVIRGPASTLYGADALGGVINIITRKTPSRWSGSVSGARAFQEDSVYGADTTYDLYVSGPLIADRLGLALRGSEYKRDASNPEYEVIYDPAGQPHERSIGFGGGGRTVDSTNRAIGGTLRWTPNAQHDIAFDFDTSELVYDNSPFTNNLGTVTYPLGTADSVDSAGLWRAQPRAGYALEQEFTREQWSLVHRGNFGSVSSFLSVAHIDTANKGRTLPMGVQERLLHSQIYCGGAAVCAQPGTYNGLTVAERRQIMEDTFLPRPARALVSQQYTVDARVDIPLEGRTGRHHLAFGAQYIDGELEDGVFGMELGGTGGAVQDHKMYSLFAENNWTVTDPLTLTAGVRFDDHKVFGNRVSPRAYAVYTFNPSWSIKGGVSTGFKTPKTTDLYDGITGFGAQGTSPFVGNPLLKPETSVSTELAAYWNSAGGGHNANITLFNNEFRDKIARGEVSQSCEATGGARPCANLGEYGQLGYTTYAQSINIDKARIRGVEVAGAWRILAPLSLRANYTYTDSEQLSGSAAGQPLTDTAKHMANASLAWEIGPAFSTQVTTEMRSDRFRDLDTTTGAARYYKSYSVLHLGAQYRFNRFVSLNARVNNLLDRDFTSFQTSFTDNGDGTWTMQALDDYNNKDKARNYWLSLNLAF